MKDEIRVPVSCNRDCLSGCPLAAVLRNGRLVRITGNALGGRYMRGCLRGHLFHKAAQSPQRLLQPLVRRGARGGGEFQSSSWEEALSLVAEKLQDIGQREGRRSIMRIGGSGSCRGALHNTASLTRRFLALGGGYTDTAGNFSSAAAEYTKPYLFGTSDIGADVKTLFETELVLLWGFNAADTRFGTETERVFDELRARGVPFVVIDPRRSASVERWQAEWLPIRPGTDAALMEAMLYHMAAEELVDWDAVQRLSVGFTRLLRSLCGTDGRPARTPEWAEGICGIPAQKIKELTRRFAAAQPAALLPGFSIQRTLGGEEADRLAAALQTAAGNIGVPGGSPGAGRWFQLPAPRCGKLPVPENPSGASVPVYRWADAVLRGTRGGYPADARLLYSVGGNYAVQGPDTARSIAALQAAEFVVCHDYFLTDTCRYADVVLPVTTFLERRDIVFTYSNYLMFSEKVLDPPGEARNDYEIFTDLSELLGYGRQFTAGRSADQWIDHFLHHSEVSDPAGFKQRGIYFGTDQHRVALAAFTADPQAHPLPTPSGKIEFYSPAYAAAGGPELPRWESRWRPEERGYPLLMITPHEKFRNNSQFDNLPEFKERCDDTLWINPRDAEERGIADGERVTVESAEGVMYGISRVTDGIVAGTVSCTQGAWHRRSAEGAEWGVNALTSAEPTLPSEGSRTHSIKVEVWRSNRETE
jgi:anaerobic dimethyl sulfoxide reductase subunit A